MNRRAAAFAAALLVALASSAPGGADEAPADKAAASSDAERPAARSSDAERPLDRLRSFIERAAAGLRAAADAHRRWPPRRVVPSFAPRSILTADLGAPLLAMVAGSIDGDRRSELILLTTAEVVVVWVGRDGGEIVARRALGGPPASIRPRDPVGGLAVVDRDGDGIREIVARSSERSDAAVVALARGALVERGRTAGFPLCGGHAELVAGRSHFASGQIAWDGRPAAGLPAEAVTLICPDDLVDRLGRPLAAMIAVDTASTLHLRCAGEDGSCGPPTAAPIAAVGYAVALGDLDGDGAPEVVYAGATAPGEGDEVVVLGRRRAAVRELFRRRFAAGVAGVVAADLDGDGAAEVVVAERSYGSGRVTLWRLTR